MSLVRITLYFSFMQTQIGWTQLRVIHVCSLKFSSNCLVNWELI